MSRFTFFAFVFVTFCSLVSHASAEWYVEENDATVTVVEDGSTPALIVIGYDDEFYEDVIECFENGEFFSACELFPKKFVLYRFEFEQGDEELIRSYLDQQVVSFQEFTDLLDTLDSIAEREKHSYDIDDISALEFYGSAFGDYLFNYTHLSISAWGDSGEDWIISMGINSYIDGGDGDDILRVGSLSPSTILGGAGNDSIHGGYGDDELVGGDGHDVISGGAGDDVLEGGTGNDHLRGGDGDDRLYGGEGSDRLWGQGGNDFLYGDSSNDKLSGGPGEDALYGGTGYDELYGGLDSDFLDAGTEEYNEKMFGDKDPMDDLGEDELDHAEDTFVFNYKYKSPKYAYGYGKTPESNWKPYPIGTGLQSSETSTDYDHEEDRYIQRILNSSSRIRMNSL